MEGLTDWLTKYPISMTTQFGSMMQMRTRVQRMKVTTILTMTLILRQHFGTGEPLAEPLPTVTADSPGRKQYEPLMSSSLPTRPFALLLPTTGATDFLTAVDIELLTTAGGDFSLPVTRPKEVNRCAFERFITLPLTGVAEVVDCVDVDIAVVGVGVQLKLVPLLLCMLLVLMEVLILYT